MASKGKDTVIKEKWQHLTPANAPQVIVSWRDIHEISSWNEETIHLGPVHLETIGWLLYEGPDPNDPGSSLTIIAKTYDYEDRRWAEFTIFPQTVVKKVKKCADSERF